MLNDLCVYRFNVHLIPGLFFPYYLLCTTMKIEKFLNFRCQLKCWRFSYHLVPVVFTFWIILVHRTGFVVFLFISVCFVHCVILQLPFWHFFFFEQQTVLLLSSAWSPYNIVPQSTVFYIFVTGNKWTWKDCRSRAHACTC